ncbi:hypothetical protein ACPOLB_25125 [Rubrivivax sp. RP6-9]|uniref:hypothetical protein n=1 Tax=Rubrivivax sp. RP6-9 TaxID=3415750 RepID=UPI003CC66EB1
MPDSTMRPTRPLPDLSPRRPTALRLRAAGATSRDRLPQVIALRPSRLHRLMQALGLR